jgi:hypothetical protein
MPFAGNRCNSSTLPEESTDRSRPESRSVTRALPSGVKASPHGTLSPVAIVVTLTSSDPSDTDSDVDERPAEELHAALRHAKATRVTTQQIRNMQGFFLALLNRCYGPSWRSRARLMSHEVGVRQSPVLQYTQTDSTPPCCPTNRPIGLSSSLIPEISFPRIINSGSPVTEKNSSRQ